MDQSIQIKVEFFELIKILNKSNLSVNQKTEISFFIEAQKDKLILLATTNKNYSLQLVCKKSGKDWFALGFSGLINLENELSRFASIVAFEKLNQIELTKLIKSFIFQKFDQL